MEAEVRLEVWFGERFEPDWRRLTPEEARASFAGAGLHGPFRELAR